MLIKGIILYLLLANLIGLFVMAEDKKRARKHKWRIPEKTLFLVSVLGGSLGTWAGMYLFHHKTKHWYFWAVNIAGLLWQALVLLWLLKGVFL